MHRILLFLLSLLLSHILLLLMLLVHFFPFFLLGLLQHAIVIQQLQVLKVIGVRRFDPLLSLIHDPEKCLGFVEGNHENFEVICLYVVQLFVCRKDTLLFDHLCQAVQRFECRRIMLLVRVNVVFISDAFFFDSVEEGRDRDSFGDVINERLLFALHFKGNHLFFWVCIELIFYFIFD